MIIKNKKAQANIILIILIILMILILIIVIWNIVYSTTKQSSGKVSIEQFKVKLSFDEKNAVTIENNIITIKVHRGTGKGDLKAIKFIFKDANGNQEIINRDTPLPDELETITYTFYPNEFNDINDISTITRVSFIPMFEDDNGDEVYGIGSDDEEVNSCKDGETRSCGVGVCAGTKTCGADGLWSDCSGGTGSPTETICNDELDNDCDGSTDCFDSDCGGDYCNLITSEALVSWWKLNENANDEKGINNGVAQGGVSFIDNDGIRGDVAVFDGSSGRIEIADSVVNNYPFTISAWMKTDEPDSTATIVSISDEDTSDFHKIFIFNGYPSYAGRTAIKVQVQPQETPDSRIITSSNINNNEWYHVVGVFTGSSRKIYTNAGLPPGIDNYQWTFGDMAKTTIGRNNNAEYFNGRIDDVMIFNRDLSSTEIITLYNNQKPPI